MTTHRLRKGASAALLLGMLLTSPCTFALPEEHEVRRLMMATEQAVDAGRWEEAGDYLNELAGMPTPKPDDFLYFRGRVQAERENFLAARSALEDYVEAAGAEGAHYSEALQAITRIDRQKAAAESKEAEITRAGNGQNAANQPAMTMMIEPSGSGSIESLKKLYLTSSATKALQLHINGLLDLAGWTPDQRIIRMDEPAQISYQIDAGNGQLGVVTLDRTSGVSRMTSESIDVFGINPNLKSDCIDNACWIYDPRDGDRWLKLAGDRERAREIADNLGLLIREMQKGQ